jgi:hypothetical protein
MQWAQAVGVLALACFGAFIAYKQVRIATAKLNLDLYEKRFAVFNAARNFHAEFTVEGKMTRDMLDHFIFGTSEAVFLFEGEVKAFLDHLRDETFSLRHLAVSLKSAADNDERRGEIADKMAQIETELMGSYPKLVALFKPYLKLGNI